jgi:hypothetical protein
VKVSVLLVVLGVAFFVAALFMSGATLGMGLAMVGAGLMIFGAVRNYGPAD